MLTVLVAPFSVAVSTAVWCVVHEPAVTVNVAEVEPAGTVTDAGTGRTMLLLDRDTVVPALGAAWAKVTVQVDFAPVPKLVGEHCNEDNAGCQFCTVIVPEVAVIPSAEPFAKDAMGLITAIGTVDPLVAAERVTETVATAPLATVESDIPAATQVSVPLAEAQVRVLPAVVSAVPAVTATDIASVGTNSSAH